MSAERQPKRGRISVLIPNLFLGGAERYAINMSSELSRLGHDVDLVVGDLSGPLVDKVPVGVRAIDLRHRRMIATVPALVRYLRAERPDAMLTALTRANILAVFARRLAGVSTRVVVSEHIALSELRRGRRQTWKGAGIGWLAKRSYPRAAAVVAVSGGVASDLVTVMGLAPDSVKVIFNPVITADLAASMETPDPHPWLNGTDEPVVIGAGRLSEQKAFDDLIRAFAEVLEQRSAKLLILGEGREREHLEDLANTLGISEHVDLPGYVDNAIPYISRACVFVLSSRWEGLPTVLIEALYAGVPIVATDISGSREILADGEHGLLTPVGDYGALADAITKALDGDVARPSEASWQRFEARRVAKQYQQLLLTRRTGA